MTRIPGPWVFSQSLSGYSAESFRLDASAGLAIAAVALPSAIAYPAIAGLPSVVGIYASMVPLIGYALFGSSRQLIVGPDAATMTVLAAVLAGVAIGPGDERVNAAAALALGVGLLCFVASLIRLGFVASFLSRPILVGFMAGVSISIITGQISRLTGVKVDDDGVLMPFVDLARRAAEIHWPTLLFGGAMFALLQLLKYVRSPIPGPVVVVVIAIALSAAFKLETYGIRVVGDIPSGLPALTVPWPTALGWRELILGSAAVWMVSFGAGIVTAKSFGARANFRIDPNAELIGFGAANVAAGLFSGFPVTASDSRTAINMTVGGRTQVASFVAAAALAATLLFLNDALRLLPTPALGAILVSAAISLIDIDSLRSLWRISRFEFAFAVIGIWGVLSLGVLNGVVVAISATLVYLFVKGLYPRDAMLGRIPGRDGFYKLHRTLAARPVPGLELMVIQGSLLFFNVDYVRSRLEEKLAELPEGARWFILDCGAIAQLDSTAADMLAEVHALFASKGITLGLAELNTEPKQVLERAGVLDVFGRKLIFEDLEEALVGFEASSERG